MTIAVETRKRRAGGWAGSNLLLDGNGRDGSGAAFVVTKEGLHGARRMSRPVLGCVMILVVERIGRMTRG